MSLTYKEKNIYNTHLKVSRTFQNKPWRPRENFDKISPVEEETIKKINNIIDSKNNINIENYFRAPYELWGDTTYYPLEYFTKSKAIKAYKLWINKLFLEDPDNDIVIDMVKEGFLYIYRKCKEHNLKSIESYFELKSFYPDFIVALGENSINYYNVLSINNYDKILKEFSKDEIDFIVYGFYNTIETLRSRYYRSQKLKKLNEKIKTKLNKILNKN